MSDSGPEGPAAGAERILWIDALRGVALFGIVLANYPDLSGITQDLDARQAAFVHGEVSRRSLDAFLNLVLDGKFYTLFSLLFGLGFTLQLDRLSRRSTDGVGIFRRRMAALLLIGGCHLLFIFDGDILVLYALLGLVLPLFRRVRDATLLAWGFVLVMVVPAVGIWWMDGGPGLGAPLQQPAEELFVRLIGIPMEKFDYVRFMADADWHDYAVMRGCSSFYSLGGRLEDWRFAKVLGTMLLGMWAGRRLIEGTLYEDRRRLWAILIGGLALGLPATVIYAGYAFHSQDTLASQVGTLPMGLAYAAGFALAWPKLGALGRVFVPLGRMALTNYLLHSTIGVVLFTGIGFGLMGEVTVLQALAITLAVFAFLTVSSHWWLARHEQGPVEALWRRMTYGKATRSVESTSSGG